MNGNYSGYGFFGCSLPFFDKALSIDPSANLSYSRNINYINSEKNTTTNASANVELGVSVELDFIEFTVNGQYDYTIPKTTLNNEVNQPYSSYSYGFDMEITLPKKFVITTDAEHTFNNQRSDGYNINYFIWNAEFGKKFGKKENLIVGVKGFDLLNQNINNQRYVNANVVTDSKTTIVKRYILLELTYKFNSNKAKATDEEEF